MESTQTTFEAFESIKKSKVFTKTDVIRFVEKHTFGFKPQLIKALKFDLDIYVENNLFKEVVEKYEQYRSEENPTYLEIMFSVYENLNKHGYSSTHEAWRLVFDKILSTKFNFEDSLFDVISNFIDLESCIWGEISSNEVNSILLDPREAAKRFIEREQYRPHPNSLTETQIAEIMQVAKEFIEEENISNIFYRVNTVVKRCKALGLEGSKNTQKNYIEYYASLNGCFNKPDENVKLSAQ